MLSIQEVKKLLGREAGNLSDDQIKHIAELVDRLTDIAFEVWLKNRSKFGRVEESDGADKIQVSE